MTDTSPTSHLIEALTASGFATAAMLERSVRSRMAHGGSLAAHLVLHGVMPDELVSRWFSRRYNLPRVDEASLGDLAPEIVRLLPIEIVYEGGLLPLRQSSESSLLVGWVDPTEPARVEEAEFFAGYAIETCVISALSMARTFERVHGRSWKVPSEELAAFQRGLEPLIAQASRIFDWLDELAAYEASVEPFFAEASSASFRVLGSRPEDGVPEQGDIRRNLASLRVSSAENSIEFIIDRDMSAEIPVREISGANAAVSAGNADEIAIDLNLQASALQNGATSVFLRRQAMSSSEGSVSSGTGPLPAEGGSGTRPMALDLPATHMRASAQLVVSDLPALGSSARSESSEFASVHELRPASVPDPMVHGAEAHAAAPAPPEPNAQHPAGATRLLSPVGAESPHPVPAPPVAEAADSGLGQNASLTTGTFRAPTAEQIEIEQARRRMEALPRYRTGDNAANLRELPTDSGSQHTTEEDVYVAETFSERIAGSRPRLPVVSSASPGIPEFAVPVQGTFHRPSRLFDSSGPALGVTRAAFRTVVKSLDICESRDEIAREIVEGLGIIYANVVLLTLRMPQLVVWDAALRRGPPRLAANCRFDLEEGTLWQRVCAETLGFRGRLPDNDPLRVAIGRPLSDDSLAVPLTMNRRTIAVLVLDGGDEMGLPASGGQFEALDTAVSGAFRRVILNRKRPQWHAS